MNFIPSAKPTLIFAFGEEVPLDLARIDCLTRFKQFKLFATARIVYAFLAAMLLRR
jgi:hypothetical protein